MFTRKKSLFVFAYVCDLNKLDSQTNHNIFFLFFEKEVILHFIEVG